jgi:hypothetical protein
MYKHFLYRHIRLDKNEVFYVGIGTKKPWFTSHETEYRRAYEKVNRKTYWKNITNKTEYRVEILMESNDYGFIKNKEYEFIKLYGRKDLQLGTLVNLTDGGEGNAGRKVTEVERKAMSLRNKGVAHNMSKVYQYDSDGKFVKEWKCAKWAEKELNLVIGSIGKCINGYYIMTGNSYWSKEKLDIYKKPFAEVLKKVYQYDMSGNFIQEWKNIKEVAKHFKCSRSAIDACVCGKNHSSQGYIWRDVKTIKTDKTFKIRNFKKIERLIINGEAIDKFESMRELWNKCFSEKTFKDFKDSILKCISGKRKSAYGYKFRYVHMTDDGIDGQSPNAPQLR